MTGFAILGEAPTGLANKRRETAVIQDVSKHLRPQDLRKMTIKANAKGVAVSMVKWPNQSGERRMKSRRERAQEQERNVLRPKGPK